MSVLAEFSWNRFNLLPVQETFNSYRLKYKKDPVGIKEEVRVKIDSCIKNKNWLELNEFSTLYFDILIKEFRYEEALKHAEEMEELAVSSGNNDLKATAWYNLARINAYNKKFNEALRLRESLVHLGEEGKISAAMLARGYVALSNSYGGMGMLEQVKHACEQALKQEGVEDDEHTLIHANLNLGNYYSEKKQFDIALKHYTEVITRASKAQELRLAGVAYRNAADVFFEQGKMEEADHLLEQAERLHIGSKDKMFLKNILSKRAQWYEANGNTAKAVEYLHRLIKNQDELASVREQQNLEALKIKMEVEREKNEAKLIREKNKELEATLKELKEVQAELIRQERMATLGSLAQEIAHEVQNPLNFINNFLDINQQLLKDVLSIASKLENEDLKIASLELEENSKIIKRHGENLAGIVGKLLDRTRGISHEQD